MQKLANGTAKLNRQLTRGDKRYLRETQVLSNYRQFGKAGRPEFLLRFGFRPKPHKYSVTQLWISMVAVEWWATRQYAVSSPRRRKFGMEFGTTWPSFTQRCQSGPVLPNRLKDTLSNEE